MEQRLKKGPANKEETKQRIINSLTEHKMLAKSALAILSQTAFYTLPSICTELSAEGKIEIVSLPSATYYKLKGVNNENNNN